MSDQNQAANQEVAADQQITVRIGFEQALDQASPTWRENWSQAAVDNARFFYNAGVRDTSIFASSAVQNMNQAIANLQSGYQSINELAQRPQQGGVIPPEIAAAAATEETPAEDTSAEYDAVQAEHDAVVKQQSEDETSADLDQAQHDESQAAETPVPAAEEAPVPAATEAPAAQ